MNRKLILFVTVAFFCGVIATLIIFQLDRESSEISHFSERRESGFRYINPLLECEYSDSIGGVEYRSVKSVIEEVIHKNPSIETAVYFRDLSNGPWFGVNEKEPFAPQSLLKLPLAIAYFKEAEINPDTLSRTIQYDKPIANQNISDTLELGQKYSVEYLIYRSLALSDNVAFNLLALHLPSENIKKVHIDLGIPYPRENTPDEFISVKEYASLFRVLYNSSYLSRQYSEQLLQILIQSEYKEALVAGVPENIDVAHKYGIRNENTHEISQLHDCGIVYHPKRPYILCIMSKGTDEILLLEKMKALSEAVYKEVNKLSEEGARK